jgi:hypothetical protein
MKSNRTILAIALNIATCAGVLLTAPAISAQEEKATASTSATKDDSGKQAATSGKVAALPSYRTDTAQARQTESKKEDKKKTKRAKKSKKDNAGTEAGTSGKK